MTANSRLEYKALERAIRRNPGAVRDQAQKFLVRAKALMQRGINQTTWDVGNSGGGVPKLSHNLKRAHDYTIRPFSLLIKVNEKKADYAKYVHYGTRHMKARPWLKSVKNSSMPQIKILEKQLLKEVVKDFGK